ncbi:MAG: hypothetical protein ACOCUL_04360, partial [Bacteroidota bacterium]
PKTEVKKKLKNEIEVAEYGILTPVNNEIFYQEAMEIMIQNKALYESFKAKAKNRANDFSKKNIVSIFEGII